MLVDLLLWKVPAARLSPVETHVCTRPPRTRFHKMLDLHLWKFPVARLSPIEKRVDSARLSSDETRVDSTWPPGRDFRKCFGSDRSKEDFLLVPANKDSVQCNDNRTPNLLKIPGKIS